MLRCLICLLLIVGVLATSVPTVNATGEKISPKESTNEVAKKLLQEDERLKVLEDDLSKELTRE